MYQLRQVKRRSLLARADAIMVAVTLIVLVLAIARWLTPPMPESPKGRIPESSYKYFEDTNSIDEGTLHEIGYYKYPHEGCQACRDTFMKGAIVNK